MALAGAVLGLGCPVAANAGHGSGRAFERDEPLVSRFAADVDRDRPRAEEHPRPQLRRAHWRSLNGTWRVQLGSERRRRDILVPFPYQAPLSGIGTRRIHEEVRYTRHFRVPRGWRGKRLRLNFGAVDWEARVYLNGDYAGRHRGGYTPFSLDVTDELRRGGARQRLTVVVHDPVRRATQALGKQRARGTIFYTRTTGIWQSVWIEPVDERHVRTLRLTPELAAGRLTVAGRIRGGAGAQLEVKVRDGEGRVVARERTPTADRVTSVRLAVADVRPWSPESPSLYQVDLRVRRGGRTLDHVRSYTAFRSVDVRDGRFHLNGKPYFLRGVLDQGFWPEGLYAAPTDRALRHDVEQARAYGFNLARKHVKVEDARWYHWADRLGLLVAQDMPSSWDLRTAGAREQFADEWREMIDTLRDHPSVAIWIAFNENWGRPTAAFQSKIVDLAREVDPSRVVIDGSGSPRRENSDMTDFHDYGDDLLRYGAEDPQRARWIGEYGGITLKQPGHVWKMGRQRFTSGSRTQGDMVERYRFLTDQVNAASGLSGFVYTQLTDVENELNGLLTYDRVRKVEPEVIRPITVGRSP